jgi:hypothetical protein
MEINNQDGLEPLQPIENLVAFEETPQPKVEYFSTREPFLEKKVVGSTVMLPGVTTKEKSENIEEFTSLIESNELDSSRPEWVDESFKKAFENGSDSLITPNGIHQDVNVDDYDNVITYGKDDLLTKKATFKKTNNVNTNAALCGGGCPRDARGCGHPRRGRAVPRLPGVSFPDLSVREVVVFFYLA